MVHTLRRNLPKTIHATRLSPLSELRTRMRVVLQFIALLLSSFVRIKHECNSFVKVGFCVSVCVCFIDAFRPMQLYQHQSHRKDSSPAQRITCQLATPSSLNAPSSAEISPETKESNNADRVPGSFSNPISTPSALYQHRRDEVLNQLKQIIDPDLNSDIVTLGFVKNLELINHKTDTYECHENDDNEEINSRHSFVVKFDVELTTPACPVKEQFKVDCERVVHQLDWVDSVLVTMTAQVGKVPIDTDVYGMSRVGSIIAVSSCKGGVGKSTTAVNLAFTLQQQGASVGILDADVYGPSLPTMVTPDDDFVRFLGRQIAPLEREGVKLMSFGYVNEGSAIMRGPMVTQLLDQFLAVTAWGPLDYLILDMPPGTGDIQLSLTQRLNITAAVIVTTPTELSFADVVRGIEMFDAVNVPCIAVVENMAYYQLPSSMTISQSGSGRENMATNVQENLRKDVREMLLRRFSPTNIDNESGVRLADETLDELVGDLVQVFMRQPQSKSSPEATKGDSAKIRIFGNGHKHRLASQYGIEHTFSVPLLERIASDGDNGTPYVLQNPDSESSLIYHQLAAAVVTETAKIKYGSGMYKMRPEVVYHKDEHVIAVTTRTNENVPLGIASGTESVTEIKPSQLRRNCRCASCVEEFTGRQILVPANIPETVYPTKMYPTGNYAVSVDWSDGHRSLYPYKLINALVSRNE